ncbi:MAG: leader peptidase (prepilin peptidase) / N-methyltransferase [Candidatus Peregrinibacteria bacterium Greene0416_19]|nr:MAG: leader peptidase (prepilin peptidase) / N-methyltransferase [Candidatus Peregrinibacteria bacterium Greene0416_19]
MLVATFVLLGLAFGSFGNVLILRLPRRRSIAGRSACPRCRALLRWYELIPVVSFLFLRGRCGHCGAAISWQYPVVEAGSALLFLAALFHERGGVLTALPLACALWLLFLIAVTDARTRLIPDALSLPFLLVSVLYAVAADAFSWWGPLLAGGFFALQWVMSRGRWIGSGDILLGLGIGALLSAWQSVYLFLTLSYVTGALYACALLLLRRRTSKDMLPFGPFLALGAMLTVFFGDWMLWWMGMM